MANQWDGIIELSTENTVVPAAFNINNGNITGLAGPGGSVYFGPVASGVWMRVPSIFRLEMTGTGAVTLDSMDSLGNITSGVYSTTLSGATNEIGFPYAGDAAVAIRATLTGSATAKVI